MRQFSYFLLLVTAPAPVLAAGDQDRGERHRNSGESDQSESRPQRSNENRSSESHPQRSVTVEHPQSGGHQSGIQLIREHYQQQHQGSVTTQSDATQPAATLRVGDDTVRNWHRGERQGTSGQSQTGQSQTQTDWRARERHVRTVPDTQVTTTQPTSTQPGGIESRSHHRDYRDGNYTRWSHDWRHDRRYDWYNWRNHHHSTFHLGFYNDPFGWNYRRWSIGSFLYPSFYGSDYWLNDPWQYRLPPAYGPYRWVRYWDDALLVNLYTGEVVDVMHNFFW